jgi:hypothetical protein
MDTRTLLQIRAARQSLDRLRVRAPRLYEHLIQMYDRPRGLGAVDWGDVGKNLITSLSEIAQYKEISEQERKAAQLELQTLQVKNAAIERQLQLQRELAQEQNRGLEIQQRAAIAGESIMDQLKQKPWAIPALIGLVGLWMKSRKSGKSRQR